ncbi:NADP-specific glutamate dehydrogenase, partial [Francisella tularensis subsp. holarctica]|nr:NADP-specific glutamate dehydrogenase [Francisella tularensis subsp. holarctica]
EIGYMYGQYRRIRACFVYGVLSGKSLESGGSLIRPEATGSGAVFFLDEMLKRDGENLLVNSVVSSCEGSGGGGGCK